MSGTGDIVFMPNPYHQRRRLPVNGVGDPHARGLEDGEAMEL